MTIITLPEVSTGTSPATVSVVTNSEIVAPSTGCTKPLWPENRVIEPPPILSYVGPFDTVTRRRKPTRQEKRHKRKIQKMAKASRRRNR